MNLYRRKKMLVIIQNMSRTISLPVTVTQSLADGWDGTKIEFNKESENYTVLEDGGDQSPSHTFQLNLLCGKNTYVCNGSEDYPNYREELSFTVQDTKYKCEDCGPENKTCTFQIDCPNEDKKDEDKKDDVDTINNKLDEYNVKALNNLLVATLEHCRPYWSMDTERSSGCTEDQHFDSVQDLIKGTTSEDLHNIYIKCLKGKLLGGHPTDSYLGSLKPFNWREEMEDNCLIQNSYRQFNLDNFGYNRSGDNNYINRKTHEEFEHVLTGINVRYDMVD